MNGARCAFDLIAELDRAGPKHRVVALAVAFENSSVLIYADDPDRLRFLNEAIEAGGYPAGLIAIDYDGRELVIMTNVFECDAAREEHYRAYLRRLAEEIAKRAEKIKNNE